MDMEDNSNWKRRNGYGRWFKLKEKGWIWKINQIEGKGMDMEDKSNWKRRDGYGW